MASSSEQTPPSIFNVALVQMSPKPLDPDCNYNIAVAHIRDAASKGASLALLPEYHLTGWEPEAPEFASLASTAWEYVHKYQDVAKEAHINIVPGTIVTTDPNVTTAGTTGGSHDPTTSQGDGTPPRLFNVAPFVSHAGELLGVYTKVNLWLPERPYLTAHPPIVSPPRTSGIQTRPATREPHEASRSRHTVISTPLGPVGLLTCWDLAFPEAFRALIKQGARLIIIPSYWMNVDIPAEAARYSEDTESIFLKATLVARAFENTCAIAFCNVGGDAGKGFIGLSQVALPLKGVAEGDFRGPEVGMRIVEVDMRVVDVAERAYGIRADMGSEGWHYGDGYT
ncbi:hypothetical protein AJ79_10031 [Helicocarpus griseus UAMH5409]|uniref:CN hydrolase domain-containing protein n=1 Tax=Helicocarpus griseus UAMH5409 TaxID=1447875 RepID=A0A2B7WFY7_9EURO|nr:hypothetical protein AJ79_10031 [Helicocarpus griseus UAMH5409]